jgi:hypothetical protein
MLTQSTNGESTGSHLLMGSVIVASALMVYAAFAGPQVQPVAQAATHAPVVEQVVVTAQRHVS